MADLFKTYDMVGIKEDVSDIISNISPTLTPFQSMIGNEKCNATLFQWQEDDLAAVDTNNAKVEGFEAQDTNLTPTRMRSNYTQILSKTIRVSETADAVSTYGRAKETAYQLSKKSAEMKRDLEAIFVGIAQNAAAGTGSASGPAATARKFGNVFGNDVEGNAIISPAVTKDHGVTPVALSEDDILDVHQMLYTEGSDADVIMVKPSDALVIAGFANSAGRTRSLDAGDRKIVNAVDLYVSPYGEQRVVLNRFQMASTALLIQASNWSKVTLRPWTRELLAKTGDSHRHMMVGELSLKHKNYKATGLIKGLA